MSKKTLLEEATVRRFMKLANVSTLSDQLISEMGYGHMGARDEEEGEDVEMADEAPEAPEDMGPEEGPAMADEAPEADADEVEITEEDRDALAAAIAVLEKITGGEADAGGEEMDMGMDEPMADEPMADEPMADEEEEPMMEMGHEEDEKPMKEGADLSTKGSAGKGTFSGQKDHKLSKAKTQGLAGQGSVMEEGEESDDEEEPLDEVELVDEADLVNEVTRRVAERLRAVLKKRK